MTRRPPLLELRRGGRHDRLHRRAGGPRRHARERLQDLLRRRHLRVRRHGPDRRALRARRGDAADRRLLHDGAARGGQGRRAARREARHARRTTARSRSCTGTPQGLRDELAKRGLAARRSSTRSSPAARSNDLLAGRVRPRGAASGASRSRRSSWRSARSSRGRAATSARSRPRATRTSPTAPDGLELLAGGALRPGGARPPRRADDPGRDQRQVGIVDAAGGIGDVHRARAASTGRAGAPAPCYAAQGNILAGPQVVDALADTFLGTEGPLAERLLAALAAGDAAGGDRRGPAVGVRDRAPDRRGLRRQQRHPDRPARGRPHRPGGRAAAALRHPRPALRADARGAS